ncbi:hypothetical protein Hanom_Chr09g00800991 [Helianthus anomalus]
MHLCSYLFMFMAFTCYSNIEYVFMVTQGLCKPVFIASLLILIVFLSIFFGGRRAVKMEQLDGSFWGVLLVLAILLFLAFLPA